MNRTVFDRYGGFAFARKIVSSFYDRVLDSPVLEHHFAGLDMARLVDHQAKFVAQVMGGPAAYTDEQLRRVHAALGITKAEFTEMSMLLEETLEDFDLKPEDVAVVRKAFCQREAHIVAARA